MNTDSTNDNDWLDLTGIPEHLQGFRILQHKIRWRLAEALGNRGIDIPPDELFVNAVNNLDERLVIYRASLIDFTVKLIQEGQPPLDVSAPTVGIFKADGTFDYDLRVDQGDLYFSDFMEDIQAVYVELT